MKTLTSLLALHDTRWAIEARAGRQLWHALQSTSIEIHAQEVADRGGVAERPGERDFVSDGDGIAIISIAGPMTKAETSWDSGCSTVAVRRQLRAASADPEVKGIMLRVYSPGGSVAGTEALANDIAAAAKAKPMSGFGEDLAASAALWALSQCGTVCANATALIGSIGTYCLVYDYSKMFELAGVKALLVTTGDHKGAGAPGTEITPEQLAEFQREVDDLNSHFLGAVSKGRKMPMAQLKQIADGRVWIASEAKSLGLVDRVCSFEQAMADLRATAYKGKGARAEDGRLLVAEADDAPLFAVSQTLSLTDPAEAVAEASAPESSEATTPDTSAEAQQPEPTTNDDEALALLGLALSL